MPSTILKHRFNFPGLRNLFLRDSMSTSFYGQELQRALKEQGPAVRDYKLLNACSLQASARVKLLEGHSVDITLTQQGYKIDRKSNEGMIQIFESVEDLFRSTSPLYAQKHSEALFEALKQLSYNS